MSWILCILIFSLSAYGDGTGYTREFTKFLAQNANENYISAACTQQLRKYSEELSRRQSWALKMFDATAKCQPGTIANYGNYDQCLSINHNEIIKGKYCLGALTLPKEFNENNARSPQTLPWAVCVPHKCSANDASTLMGQLQQQILLQDTNSTVIITFTEPLCQVASNAELNLSTNAVITLCILLFLLVIIVASTTYDVYMAVYGNKKPIHAILVAFSMYRNGRKLFLVSSSKSGDRFCCLNGIRFITIMWIVLLHTYTIYNQGPVFNQPDWIDWLNSLHSMYLTGGSVAVDTFFVIGGLVLAYSFLKARDKKVPFNIGFSKMCAIFLLRLAPALGVVVLVSATLLQYMGSGPNYPNAIKGFQEPCKEYWWSTMLFVQNYVNMNHFCVGQTWYLNVDMQLYILSPLLLFPLSRWPGYTLGAITIGILAGIGIPFYVAWVYELPGLAVSNLHGNKEDYMTKYYLVTHCRFAPWLMGIILGYFIWKQKQAGKNPTFKLNKPLTLSLWGLSLAVLLACLFAGHRTLQGVDYNQWGNAAYIALVRPAWSVAVSWVIFACILGHGGAVNYILSLSVFQVLERLTYSIYLVHVTMLYLMAFSRKTPAEFNDFNLMHQFWGDLAFSAILAGLLVVMVEYPAIELEKILFSIRIRKDNKIVPVV